MHHMLNEILKRKRADVRKPANTSFIKLFGKNKFVLIGEVKFASPSAGTLLSKERLFAKVRLYAQAGVSAISVITEKHFFKGDVSDVKKVKNIVSLPVLQKDFILDETQIYAAKAGGADALLLIARIVSAKKLATLVELCLAVGVEPIVEIYTASDLRKALQTKTRIIAVNARDLDTFVVDVNKACVLLAKVPKQYIKLGFSGIHSAHDVNLYKHAGARGVLIGTALVQAKSPKQFVEEVGI